MERVLIWPFFILLFLIIFPRSNSVDDEAKKALIQFMDKLSQGNSERKNDSGWNMSSDPCRDHWHGVFCDKGLNKVHRIVLETMDLNGVLDATWLCTVKSIMVLSLQYNNVTGNIPSEIANCKSLTHLYLSGNKFSGYLPESLPNLKNLKRLHIANNDFYGNLPNLLLISGLKSFLAENNNLNGSIPSFNFSNFDYFNVSNNNFSGPIPDVKGKFSAGSFLGNPYLCGKPLPNDCPEIIDKEKHKKFSVKHFLVYSGYAILGLVIFIFVIFKLLTENKKKPNEEERVNTKKSMAQDKSSTTPSTTISSEFKHKKSEYSLTISENGISRSLVVLQSSMASGLTFEELLKAPAKLLGRGKHGSLYKVTFGNEVVLAVKRIKDWEVLCKDFDRRMRRIDNVKHRNVMSPIAYYSSVQEKLLVYEFQENGSLFKLLHESQRSQAFDWPSRLNVASSIAEALSFMHEELHEDNIAHGNLKSMNILFSKTMEPMISEYGLMVIENQDESPVLSINTEDSDLVQPHSTFKADVYAFGVIILELLTGRLVQKNGFDLPNWVRSVVREEWTVDLFDKALTLEGASEERMLNLLQVALKCISPFPNERPIMRKDWLMINAIKEEEEKSTSSAP